MTSATITSGPSHPLWGWARDHWVRLLLALVVLIVVGWTLFFFAFLQVGSKTTHVNQQRVTPSLSVPSTVAR